MQEVHDIPDALQGIEKRNNAIARAEALLNDRIGQLPVWVRAPRGGLEPYTGLSRSFLYHGAANGLFRSASIREPGKERGCRLFHLQSILAFIEKHEQKGVAQ